MENKETLEENNQTNSEEINTESTNDQDQETTSETANQQTEEAPSPEDLVKEANDKYLRLAAEFDNYRKRIARENIEIRKNAAEDLIRDLIDVLDDSKRAKQQMEQSDDLKIIKEGVTLVFQKLNKTLESRGLQEMKSINEEFDPELHEALTEIPAPSPELSGKIIDEISTGYQLNDKIIRHAKVVVGK